MRRTENVFIRYGVRSLIVAKFIPGLSTVAPPLAGIVGVSMPRFVLYSALAALLWAGTWSLLGYLAGDAVQHVTDVSGRLGAALVALVVAAIVGYVAVKWIQRRRFLRKLRIARIGQEELKRDLDVGKPVLIVDLRWVALALRRHGVTRVRPLAGGFPAWRDSGLPVEPAAPAPGQVVVSGS